MKDGREVVGISDAADADELQALQLGNTVSEEWEEQLTDGLRIQGGEALRDIEVKKERSLILMRDGVALNVESVHITLINQEQETTTFRAMVDSQTGKILQTWDQPIIDPINPREGFKIKVDPRYLQQ